MRTPKSVSLILHSRVLDYLFLTPVAVDKKLKCHHQVVGVSVEFIQIKNNKVNPVKHLLYVCANDCWNEVKAKSNEFSVEVHGLVTNNTNCIHTESQHRL